MPQPFHYHRLIVGYHGCDRSVGEDVLVRSKVLEVKENPYDWLGKGIYFWEHGLERAMEWARWKRARGDIEDPIVLGAYIHLGSCFDLTDVHATGQLKGFYESLKSTMDDIGQEMPKNKKAKKDDFDLVLRHLDCAVLNFGLEQLEGEDMSFDTVRGVFPEGAAAFPGAKILMKTHVQVAVRNPACIIGYFKPTGYDVG